MHLLERRSLLDLQPDHESDEHENQAEQERNSPAVREELGVVEDRLQRGEDAGAQRESQCQTDLGDAAEDAAPLRGTVFDGEEHGARPFTAQRESLQDAEQEQQHRRDHPDLRGGR